MNVKNICNESMRDGSTDGVWILVCMSFGFLGHIRNNLVYTYAHAILSDDGGRINKFFGSNFQRISICIRIRHACVYAHRSSCHRCIFASNVWSTQKKSKRTHSSSCHNTVAQRLSQNDDGDGYNKNDAQQNATPP